MFQRSVYPFRSAFVALERESRLLSRHRKVLAREAKSPTVRFRNVGITQLRNICLNHIIADVMAICLDAMRIKIASPYNIKACVTEAEGNPPAPQKKSFTVYLSILVYTSASNSSSSLSEISS